MIIRLLEEKDIPQIINIMAKEPGVFYDYDRKNAPLHFRSSLDTTDSRGHKYFVAEEDQKVVGVTGVSYDTDGLGTYELSWTVVSPQYQKQGLGKKLLETVEQWLKQQKARTLWLKTSFSYYKAIPFYRKMGFIEAGKIPGYFGKDDLIIMYKKYG